MCTFLIFLQQRSPFTGKPEPSLSKSANGQRGIVKGKTRGPLCACWTLTLVVGLLNLLEHKLIFKYAYEFYRHTIPRQTLSPAMHIYQGFALLKGLLYATTPWADTGHQWKPCVCGLVWRAVNTWVPRVRPHQARWRRRPKTRAGKEKALRCWANKPHYTNCGQSAPRRPALAVRDAGTLMTDSLRS